jgi:hypothetical protein
VLNPNTCGDWKPGHAQPLVIKGGEADIVVDTRLRDGCSPGFYSGADVHKSATATSPEVDLGVSAVTSGSLALNGSVLHVTDAVHGQKQTIEGTDGKPYSSDVWLHIQFPDGQAGNISAVNAGFPTVDMFNKYTS